MNIQSEYFSILRAPEQWRRAAARIGRENVLLLLGDMEQRQYLRREETALDRVTGEKTLFLTQKGRVFLRSHGLSPVSGGERPALERLAREIDALEPALCRGRRLLVTYVGGEQEAVRHAACRHSFFEGSSGWREYGGEGSLLRGLLPFLGSIVSVALLDAPAP